MFEFPIESMAVAGVIITTHFFADFVFQSHWMATNKSKSLKALSAHVAVYTACLLLLFGWKFAAINGALHFITDFFTSKRTTKLWKQERWHDFFVTIGFDQGIHLWTLFLTYYWLAQ